jgi:hypothetical protein
MFVVERIAGVERAKVEIVTSESLVVRDSIHQQT